MEGDILTTLESLAREIAPRLPTGLNDPNAARKLADEQRELYDALRQGDWQGALTELADVGYYIGKALANDLIGDVTALRALSVSMQVYRELYQADPTPPMLDDIPRLVRAKYESRIRHGKDDARERVACVRAV
jgi:hypothetical protein